MKKIENNLILPFKLEKRNSTTEIVNNQFWEILEKLELKSKTINNKKNECPFCFKKKNGINLLKHFYEDHKNEI